MKIHSQAGFTLIELMVVIAIVGVLAAVAIPEYKRYQARARQTEARVMLAASYTALQTHYAEYGTYTSCLMRVGFEPVTGSQRWYTVGIDPTAATSSLCGPLGNERCNFTQHDAATGIGRPSSECAPGDGQTAFLANRSVGGSIPPESDLTSNAAAGIEESRVERAAFRVRAAGRISLAASGAVDRKDEWSIDHEKNLVNGTGGI